MKWTIYEKEKNKMSTNEIIRKIELLNEYEEMMEELKNEMETVRDSIKAVMLATIGVS